jgi:catechol 2,3-dioxygenase-like lactoylglutathione lyase family enzyme
MEDSTMLGSKDAVATVAVRDLPAARRFYEGTLGLTPIAIEGDEVVTYKSGHSAINVYRSKFAGTNQATAMTWDVGKDVEEVVRELRDKGVRFEHYDLPGVTRQGDIHLADGFKTAWFKDPDGNILNIASS